MRVCEPERERERPRENWRARKLGVRRPDRTGAASLSGPPPRQQLPLTPVRPMMTPDGTVITRDATALICSSVFFSFLAPRGPRISFSRRCGRDAFRRRPIKLLYIIPEARDEDIFSLSIFVLALATSASYDVMNEME